MEETQNELVEDELEFDDAPEVEETPEAEVEETPEEETPELAETPAVEETPEAPAAPSGKTHKMVLNVKHNGKKYVKGDDVKLSTKDKKLFKEKGFIG